MKNIIKGFILVFSLILANNLSAKDVNAADSTGLAGDNFSLQGAMELFKKAKSPEAFETALNSEKNNVNNLDLNEDGKTDYVKVKDIGANQSRVLVMQVDVNGNETQDIAVITIEKTGDATATIQIKGAEALYGKDLLIEPVEEKSKGGKGGPDAALETYFVWVNVWYWPCVQYVYMPSYTFWYSPWYWDYYPTWWSPWYVRPWRAHYHACYHYQPYYHQVYEYRNYDAYALYGPRMSTSPSVQNRYERSNYKSNQDRQEGKQQQVVGRERVSSFESKSNTRTTNNQKVVQPTPDKTVTRDAQKTPANNGTSKEINSGKTAPDSGRQPANVNKGNEGKQQRVNSPQSNPSKVDSNQGKQSKQQRESTPQSNPSKVDSNKGSASPSRTQQPSKAPSVGKSNSQPSGGKVAPQRSSAPPRSAPAQRPSGGGNTSRRK